MSDPESSENTPPALPGLRRLEEEEGLRVIRQMKLRLRPRFRPAGGAEGDAHAVGAGGEAGVSPEAEADDDPGGGAVDEDGEEAPR